MVDAVAGEQQHLRPWGGLRGNRLGREEGLHRSHGLRQDAERVEDVELFFGDAKSKCLEMAQTIPIELRRIRLGEKQRVIGDTESEPWVGRLLPFQPLFAWARSENSRSPASCDRSCVYCPNPSSSREGVKFD